MLPVLPINFMRQKMKEIEKMLGLDIRWKSRPSVLHGLGKTDNSMASENGILGRFDEKD
jgi:hypothetical protein